jgi:ribose 5-phosphate isomerase A
MPDPNEMAKRAAAVRAADFVQPGMVVGLGSGSTAALAVDEIGRRLRDGAFGGVIGIPTSAATAARATAAGIPLTTLDAHPEIDVTIDGADEVDPARRLIKGAGGALLREKIVASASRRLVIVVDASKLVDRLGTRYPVPLEVAEFGWSTHLAPLRALGADPVLRMHDGVPYRTDGGNLIIDARFPHGIDEPERLTERLTQRAGILETGLFLDFAPTVIVGRDDGAQLLERAD